MTAKAALAKLLLDGKTVSIKNAYDLLGISNIAREIERCIENKKKSGFGVVCTRQEKTGTSRYGRRVEWMNYKLDIHRNTPEAIQEMRDYVNKQYATQRAQERQHDQQTQPELF